MPLSQTVPDMPRRARRPVPWGTVTLVAVLAVFAAGVVRLFELRFDVGDVYPPYSTLRGDPLGAKAFFESLAALPGLRVERSLRPLSALGTEPLRPADYDNGEKTFTCFDLGEDASEWPFLLAPEAVDRLEAVLRRGGRVVITFQPTTVDPGAEGLSRARSSRRENGPHFKRGGPTAARLEEKSLPPDLAARWGIDLDRRPVKARSGRDDDTLSIAPPTPSPTAADRPEYAVPAPALASRGGSDAAFASGQEAVPWHSVVDFRTGTVMAVAARWRALYDRRGRPVIVARPFGTAGGELVLVGDSYFLSNEGLRNDPSPAVLAALVGGGRRLIFDESHLGILEKPGLMTLARRYRLQGALASVAVLVALFVWRNLVSLVPLQAAGGRAGEDAVAGHPASSGYLNLLRRSVRPRDLPAVCLAQWETGAAGVHRAGDTGQRTGTPLAARSVERLRAVVEQDAARPVRTRSPAAVLYRAMCVAAREKGPGSKIQDPRSKTEKEM